MNIQRMWLPLVLSGLTVAGCMSLEERLASNDANVRKQAEYELVKRAYRSGTQADRLAAIAKITDQDLLFYLAVKAQENTAKEGVSAVKKLADNNRTLQVARECAVADVSMAALSRITDSSAYVDIAQRAKSPAARIGAYEKITEQDRLISIAQTTKDKKIKLSAINRVTTKEKILPIVFTSPANNSIRVAAVDAELVDAFIANCSDDAVLIKMVKQHGAKLSASQCAALTKKSSNVELKELIASVADLKIAEKIRASDPNEYKGLLNAITNAKIKNSACGEMLVKGLKISQDGDDKEACQKHGLANVQFGRSLISLSDNKMKDYAKYLSDRQVADIVLHGELDGINLCEASDRNALKFREAVLKTLSTDVALQLFPEMLVVRKNAKDANRNNSSWMCESFEEFIQQRIPSDQEKLVHFIKKLNGHELKLETICAIGEKINSQEAIEIFLSQNHLGDVASSDSDFWKVLRMQKKLYLKQSAEAKSRIIADVEKYITTNGKNLFAFGKFYIGMNYLDALVVAESLGFSEDNLMLHYEDSSNGKKAIQKDFRKNWKVDEFLFDRKSKFKFLDCEDACVLPQVIRQYVKKEPGKAKRFDYTSEINHVAGGTKRDVSTIWAQYMNSKLGVRLSYDEKSGIFVITGLD